MSEDKQVIEVPQHTFSRRSAPMVAQTVPASPDALLNAITIASSNPDMDIVKMERLFALHERLVRAQSEKAFNAAMARAQALMQPVVRNQTNTHTNSTYADLAAIHDAIMPIYTAEGLSVSYDTETKNDADPIPQGSIRTVAIVGHSEGFSRRHHIDLPPDDAGSQGKINKTKVQAAGSTNSYARRFLEAMIFNIATTDDDGNGNGNGDSQKKDGKQSGPTGAKEGARDRVTPERLDELKQVSEVIRERMAADDIDGAYEARMEITDADEAVAMWSFFGRDDSKLRSALKSHHDKVMARDRELAKMSAVSKLK